MPSTYYLWGTSQGDVFNMNGWINHYRVFAGGGNDYVLTGNGNDRIYGQSGNDILVDSAGQDYLSGGADNDLIYAGAGNDTYNGGSGEDSILYTNARAGVRVDLEAQSSGSNSWWGDNAQVGQDVVMGFENVYGSYYNDVITGDAGDNKLYGLGGRDSIEDGAGNDHVYGGGDTDYLYAGTGNDMYDGGSGSDWLLFNTVQHGVNINFVNGTLVSQAGAVGDDNIGSNRFYNIETVYSGQGNDWVLANDSKAQTVYLNLGDDTVLAGRGDTYHGQNGTDTLQFAALSGVNVDVAGGRAIEDATGAQVNFSSFERFGGTAERDEFNISERDVYVEAGAGDDTVRVQSSEVSADLGAGSDTFEASGGSDVLVNGYTGSDIIFVEDSSGSVYGGDHEDWIKAEGFSGFLSGGAGNDEIEVDDLLFGADLTVDGGDGVDSLRIHTTDALMSVEVDMGAGTALARDGAFETEFAFSNIERIYTDAGEDLINGSDEKDIIAGGGGADTVFGNGGDDFLEGNGGADSLFGGEGKDEIDGGGGDDLLTGGAGQDVFEFKENFGADRIADFDAAGNAAGGDLLKLYYNTRLIDGTAVDKAQDMDTNQDGRIGAGDTGIAMDGTTLVLNFMDGTIRIEGVESLYYDSFMI